MSSKVTRAMKNPMLLIEFLISKVKQLLWLFIASLSRTNSLIPITNLTTDKLTEVDSFWSNHTAIGKNLAQVKTAYQSRKYLEWRFKQYPLFQELMELYGNHTNETVLDYGCGPASDIIGFLIYGNAKKVIGIDVSIKALQFASQRIALHDIDSSSCELIAISDSSSTIPLDDNSIDYIYSEGVLHHTSNPIAILEEFYRILKPDSHVYVMVYNENSIWLHLYVAYEQMFLKGNFKSLNLYEAFSKTTDTELCPVSKCYKPNEFITLCNNIGFDTEFIGGYFSQLELQLVTKYLRQAINNTNFDMKHRYFLNNLHFDINKLPLYKNKYAGIGGVYKLYKE